MTGIAEQLAALLEEEQRRRLNLEELRSRELEVLNASERRDLQAPWRDALALVRAWLDSDKQQRDETVVAVLQPYPRGARDLAIVLTSIAVMASESDHPLAALVEFWARRAPPT
jgi:hypothetical protein